MIQTISCTMVAQKLNGDNSNECPNYQNSNSQHYLLIGSELVSYPYICLAIFSVINNLETDLMTRKSKINPRCIRFDEAVVNRTGNPLATKCTSGFRCCKAVCHKYLLYPSIFYWNLVDYLDQDK